MRTLRLSLAGTAILALLGGLGGAVVAQEEEEAGSVPGVTSELLFEVAIAADVVPDELGKVNLETHVVEPGVDATIGIENEAIRGKALYIRSGELLIEPMVAALLWQQDARLGGSPTVAEAATSVRLLPGDLIFLPAIPFEELDEDAIVRIANPGSEPAVAIGFHTHASGGGFPGWPVGMMGTHASSHDQTMLEQVGLGQALFRLTRSTVEPGASLPVPDAALSMFYRVESGGIERTMRGPGGEFTKHWLTGAMDSLVPMEDLEFDLLAIADEPTDVLVLAVMPEPAP